LALPWAPAMVVLLSTTRLGLIWLARLALALLAIWLAMGRPATWKTWLGYATALALMLSVSLTSHAATEAQPLLPVIDDWIHILGMTVWLGGVAYLLTGLRGVLSIEARLRTRLTSLSMGRFSTMALVSVEPSGSPAWFGQPAGGHVAGATDIDLWARAVIQTDLRSGAAGPGGSQPGFSFPRA